MWGGQSSGAAAAQLTGRVPYCPRRHGPLPQVPSIPAALFCLLLSLPLLPVASAEVTSGKIAAAPDKWHPQDPEAADKLHFLGKFCYGITHSGFGDIFLEADSRESGVNILLFDDDRWYKLWRKRRSLSCEKVLALASAGTQGDFHEAVPAGHTSRSQTIQDVVRPHFWYVAAVNCRGALDLRYRLTFRNPGGDQLSFDQHGIGTLCQVFAMYTAVLLGLHLNANKFQLSNKGGVVLLTGVAGAAAFLSALCKYTHLETMRGDGMGTPFLAGVGDVFHALCVCVISGVFLLVAYGWADAQHPPSTAQPLVALTALALAQAAFLAHSWFYTDAASGNSPYESPAGGVLVCVLVGCAVVFALGLRETVGGVGSAARRGFLVRVGCLGALWLVAVPLTALIATLLDEWLRAYILACVVLGVDAASLSLLVWATHPARRDTDFGMRGLKPIVGQGGGGGYEDI